jgi:hypothetical protein
VVLGKTWRHPAAEGEDGHLASFWAARPSAWFAFAERTFWEKAIIPQRLRFDLLLAAMPEKILDQVMDVVDNVPEDFFYDTLNGPSSETPQLVRP